jgi:AAA15 family ATPase/GTPase
MIQKISIKNFKSIKNIEFDAGQINVIIGENGSGKSNILEGIALGGAAASDLLTNQFLFSRGIRIQESKHIFHSNQKTIYIEFNDILSEKYSYHIKYNNKEGLYDYHSEGYRKFLKANLKDLIKSPPNSLHNKSQLSETEKEAFLNEIEKKMFATIEKHENAADIKISNYLIFSPEVKALRNFYDEAQISPLGINGEGLFNELKRLFNLKSPKKINQIIENLKLIDWFDGMEIDKDSFIGEKKLLLKDKFLQNKIQYIDQRSTNEGFLFLLFYLTLFISEKTPKFFAIDNIEASFNPKMCVKLIQVLTKLAIENNKQVIFTTHNPYILDGLKLEDEKQRLFVVRRNLNGETVINRVQPKQKLTISLSEAWMGGLLGGLPNNF